MALTKIDDRGLKTPIDLLDLEKIRLGTGNDLEMFHNGTDAFIHNQGANAGNFYIRGAGADVDKWLIIQAKAGEDSIVCKRDAEVYLAWDGVKQIQTTSTGVSLGDDKRIDFGNSADLKIYHASGGISYIAHNHSGGEPLHITSNGDIMLKVANTEDGIIAKSNGAVELYHNNEKQVSTTANGLTINNHELKVEAPSGSVAQLLLYGDGGNANNDLWRIDAANGRWDLYSYQGSGVWETHIKLNDGGAVELYYDDSKKLKTTAAGIEVESTGNTPQIDYIGASNNTLGRIDCDASSISTSDMRFYVETGGSIVERLRIDSNGMAKFTRGSTGTVGHFYANARECNILLQNDARTWKIVNYDYTDAGADNLGFHDGSADRFIIKNNGNVQIPDGDLEVASGHGIDFSATSDASGSSSELLDDYEEGTWTPSNSTVGFESGSSLGGSYTKIGNRVFFDFRVRFANNSSGVSAYIDGFPFTSAGGGGDHDHGASITYTNSSQDLTFLIGDGASRIYIYNTDGNQPNHASLSDDYVRAQGQVTV